MVKYKIKTQSGWNGEEDGILSKTYQRSFGFYLPDKEIQNYPLIKDIEKIHREIIKKNGPKKLVTII